MDNRFEFSMGAAHQVPTLEEAGRNRLVHSSRTNHSGSEDYKYGYVNDLTPCDKCKVAIHG